MAAGSNRCSRWRRRAPLLVVCGLLAALSPLTAWTDEALVAVATNFSDAARALETGFAAATDHTVKVTTGSTGKLHAQIRNGAPYDVLLAADRLRPALLEQSGHAATGSRFTYAVGRLVLWSADPDRVAAEGSRTLRALEYRRLAIANPELAPYGVAAREALSSLGVLDLVRERIVMGESVGQAHALVATGNAEIGLLALSQVQGSHQATTGSHWVVPRGLHEPIRQDAVLLRRALNNPAARAFVDYLRSEQAQATIRSFGYEVE